MPPSAEISNKLLRVKVYLPDPNDGYYRGTRFDWSGVIGSLVYRQHDYYGPWFTKTDPEVRDFVYDGPDIVAGPCSAVTGPVEEFSSENKALGFDGAKPGGTFIKIGVGVLRRPDGQDYDPYRLYEIVDSGKWAVRTTPDSIQFTQQVTDPRSGYAYVYTKTLRLAEFKPEMRIEHSLKNTGTRPIETSVYDHNFLVLGKQPIGPDFLITLPFNIKSEAPLNPELAELRRNQIAFLRILENRDTVFGTFSGFSGAPADYNIRIENTKLQAGMQITGDRPLTGQNLWSIRSVLAIEPFISMSIQPGKEFTWAYTYFYYLLD